MRRYFRAEIFLMALAFVPGVAVSQSTAQISVVPRLIRYSAALPEGTQKAGAVGVIFSIYRDQYDGAPLWSETQNVSADKGAAYSVLLGSTRNEGLPIDIFTAGEPRWLEAEINGVKEPRVLIGSVPYAMVAADAQTLGGLPPSAYLRVGASSTSTTTNVLAPTEAVKPAFVSNGSQGYLSLFTDGSGDLGNSALYQSGSTISIGGTTSLGAMTLIGNSAFGDTAGMALYNAGGGAGASVSLDMYNTSANGGIPQAKIKALDDGSYSDHLTFWTKNPGAANNPVTERVRITSTGNVGIGTTNPGGKLDVAGNLKISGTGSGLVFPDGTTQTSGILTSSGQVSNTIIGSGAFQNVTTGVQNTAVGAYSLQKNTGGGGNTAQGAYSLQNNTTGSSNTAVGELAMGYNTTGFSDTATGVQALYFNTTGSANTATGVEALAFNTTGGFNTAVGASALLANTTGYSSTAVGTQALQSSYGSSNTAVGASAGFNQTFGSYNITLGTNLGQASDDHVIRIGDVQTQTYIAGISGVNVSGVPVVVSSTGQLGIASSSRRYKENIEDMGDASTGLMRLRPVKYNYKQPYADGSKPLEYGLIAEEVEEVYPDLVAHSQDGQIQTVMYQKLTPMLLNEVQRLRAQNASQAEDMHKMEERLARLEALLQR